MEFDSVDIKAGRFTEHLRGWTAVYSRLPATGRWFWTATPPAFGGQVPLSGLDGNSPSLLAARHRVTQLIELKARAG